MSRKITVIKDMSDSLNFSNIDTSNLSDFIRMVLFKANKKCDGCGLICFEDEHECPECKAYRFTPYTKHLENYTPEAKIENDSEIILESDLY